MLLFVSSRRRHTRCALVTGVQTCALPILLVPKEASAASSFPDDYVLDRTADGRKISKTTMMQLIGNAVPPGLAAAIIGANVKPRRSILQSMNDNARLAA